MSDSSKQWVTIGTVSDIADPAVARAVARDILMSRRDGIALSNPPTHLPGVRSTALNRVLSCNQDKPGVENTFSVLFPDYLEYCTNKKKRPNLPETVHDKKRTLTRVVTPAWGDRDIRAISRDDVRALFDGLAHIPGTAYRVYSMVHDFFQWAFYRQIIPLNPMAGMGSPFEVGQRDRYLSDDQIRWFWRACDELGWPVGMWGKMLLLTGQRCIEVRKMSRFDIDRNGVWTLPKRITKSRRSHIVFFSDFAKEVYAQIPEVDHSGLVFGSTRLNDTASKRQIDKLMLQFCREELLAAGRADFRYASIEHWVFHDLRRTAATLMAKLKHPKDIVHMILNHAAGGGASRGRAMLDQIYIIHDYQEQRQQALQDLGNYVKRVVTEPPSA